MSNIIISPESGVIEFNTGDAGSGSFMTSTAPIRLDATGGNVWFTGSNVGIGTNSPQKAAHLYVDGNDGLRIQSSNNHAFTQIMAHNDYSAYIQFRDGANRYWIQSTSDDKLRFRPNATSLTSNQIVFDADGNVGIGVADPDNPLEVSGADNGIKIYSASSDRPRLTLDCGGTDKLIVSSNSTFGAIGDGTDTNRYMVFNGGKVGIGTTSPDVILTVRKNDTVGPTIGLHNSEYQAWINSWGSTASAGRQSRFEINAGSTDFAAGSTTIRFQTPNVGDSNERMRIDADGNVGIGTTGPAELLHVDGNILIPQGKTLKGYYGGSIPVDIIGMSSTTDTHIYGGNNNSSDIFFDTCNGGTTGTRMTVTNAGNLGIGTTAPTTTLQVVGTISGATISGVNGQFSEGLFISGAPVLTGENNPAEADTLATVTARGNTTTTSIVSTGPHISGTTGLFGQGTFTRADIGSVDIFGDAIYVGEVRTNSLSDKASNGNAQINFGGSSKTIEFETDATARMFIAANGNVGVGIGSNAANQKFTVGARSNFDSQNNYYGSWVDGNTAGDSFFAVGRWHNVGGRIQAGSNNMYIHTHNEASHDLVLQSGGGYVGIGTNSPQEKLNVSGNIRIDDGKQLKLFSSNNTYNGFIEKSGTYGAISLGQQTEIITDVFLTRTDDGGVQIGESSLYSHGRNAIWPIQSSKFAVYAGVQDDGGTGGAGFGFFNQGSAGKFLAMVPNVTDANNGGFKLQTMSSSSVVEAMFFKSDGSIGIGTNSPEDGACHIYKNATIGAIGAPNKGNAGLHIEDSSNHMYLDGNSILTAGDSWINTSGSYSLSFGTNNTERVTIEAGGDVGIGTNAPNKQVEIRATTPYLRLEESNSGGDKRLDLWVEGSTGVIGANQSAQTMMFQTVGESRMTIEPAGNVGIGTTNPTELLEVDGNIRLGDGGVRDIIGPTNESLRILANPNASTEGIIFSTDGGTTNEMFIQDGGNVGIGTNAPDSNFSIVNTAGIVGMNLKAAANNICYIDFGDSSDNNIGGINYSNTDDTLNFRAANANRVTISGSNGYVGIGTAAPSDKLHVWGSVRGDFKLEGSYQGGATDVGKFTYAYAPRGGDHNNRTIASISAYNTTTDSTAGGYLSISTRATDSTNQERIRVNQDGQVDIYGNASFAQYLYHKGDEDTNIKFNTDEVIIHAGDVTFFRATETTQNTIKLNSDSTDADFYLYSTSSTPAIFMRGSDGQVGIGTNNPGTTFDLRGNMRLDSGGSTDRSIYFRNQSSVAKVRSDAALQFDVGVASSPSVAMYIEEDTRYVGIGTTNPTGTLHVYNTNTTSDGDGTATMNATGQDSIVLYGHGGVDEATYGGISWMGGSTRRRAMITAVAENTDTDFVGLAFYTQGTDGAGDFSESMRITRDGDVGLGTTSVNAGVGLQVANGSLYVTNGTANINHIEAQYFGNGQSLKLSAGQSADLQLMHYNTTDLIIKSDGKVGIGTTNPSDFHSNANRLVVGDGAGAEGITIFSQNNNAGYLYFADGTAGDAAYRGFVQYSHSTNNLSLGTAGGTKLTIASDGSVGIGSTTPLQKLDVAGVIRSSVTSRIQADVYNNSANSANIIYRSSTSTIVGNNASALVILDGGNVGIGSTSPNSKLHVEGVVSGSNSFLGTGVGNRITNNGVPYLLSGDISDTDTNTFVNAASFNTSNGVLTLTRNDSATVTTDLDGRFALSSSLGTAASENIGIGSSNVLQSDGTIVDNDFLRVNGTQIEGRSASEVRSDIDAQETIDSSNRLSATLVGANGNISNTEYGYLNGVTSAIQTQLNDRYTESEIQTFMDHSYISSEGASDLAVGWYTIATNTGNRATARFGIWDTDSSRHQSVTFYAAHKYGNAAADTITVLDTSHYGTSPFRYIRIKAGGTYDGAALQVYIDNAQNALNAAILGDNFQSDSWVLCDFIPDADTPPLVSNYGSFTESSRIDLDEIAQGGFATTGPIYADGDLNQYKVITTNDFGISDTNPVKIDSSTVADNEYARFTANGLESRSTSEVLSDIGAQSALTFGISDGNVVKCGGSVADNDFLKIDGTEVEGRTASEVKSDLNLSSSDNVSFASVTIDSLTKIDSDGTYGATYGAVGIGTSSLTNGHHRIFAKSSDHMYFAAATSKGFRFRANGGSTDHVTIDSGGDLGIGTTSPANKLDVAGGIAIGASYVGVTAPSNGAIIEGYVGIGTSSNSYYPLYVNGTLYATSKYFIIDHPVPEKKAQHKKLLHACIEGPEVAVYFRGKNDLNIIKMPDYWDSLVHIDSMTVELTPIGANQDIYVDSIADNGDVTIGSNTDAPLNYFYVVYGERKDVDKLEPEIVDPEYAD